MKLIIGLAILVVGGLSAYALSLGFDGVLLSGSMALVGALAGVGVVKAQDKGKSEALRSKSE